MHSFMKTMCPRGYYNGSVVNHALGLLIYGCNIVHHVPKCMSCQKGIVVITGGHIVFITAYVLRLSCFSES